MSDTDAQTTVTVQSYQRPGRQRRWSYVVDQPGFAAYVSPYRYGSAEAAQRAGEADAAVLEAP